MRLKGSSLVLISFSEEQTVVGSPLQRRIQWTLVRVNKSFLRGTHCLGSHFATTSRTNPAT
jgi:hypothetical protein